MIESSNDFQKRLLKWYRAHRREMPWRVPRGASRDALPNPYHVLVSEAMLQQTQVATVIPYFQRFISVFPTIRDLAAADEQAVLRLWQGLGYYSRARNLRGAATAIMERFGGAIPSDVDQLLSLPGVGRYTAGAIASLAFNRPAAVLDGNVARVLCRLDLTEDDPREREVSERLWDRATELLPKNQAADFNSAMMELGAMICTPRNPQCLLCPVARHCEALRASAVDRVPVARKAKVTPLNHRQVVCVIANVKGTPKALIEQRPPNGRWAGMWQFITFEGATEPGWKTVSEIAGKLGSVRKIAQVKHQLTHRRYIFDAWVAAVAKPRAVTPPRRWVELTHLSDFPMSRPQLLIAQTLTRELPV
jgi:A/G-specific adenine glycosylase